MNPEQMLVAIEECIKERPQLAAKLWVICWHKGRLKCLPARSTKDDGNIFGTFTVDQLNRGLSLAQWSFVSKKITEFFEKKTHTPLPKSCTHLGVIKHGNPPSNS